MIKKIITFFGVVFLLIILIIDTKTVTDAVTYGLFLCYRTILPTLFPFFVVSGLMVNFGFVTALGKAFSPVSRRLFKTSGKGAVIFIMGIFCGYPTGAKLVAEMYGNGQLSKNEGERLLAFCNNSGPLFLIGAVGDIMLKNHTAGLFLYGVHFASAILTGVLLRFFSKKTVETVENSFLAKTFGEAVSESVENAVFSVLRVCGYVVFFSVLCDVFKSPVLAMFMEVTKGAKNLVEMNFDLKTTLVLLSGIVGFGGICVALQVQSAIGKTKLSLKYYLLGKGFQAVVSMVIARLCLELFESSYAFAPNITKINNNITSVLIFLAGVILLGSRLTKKG